MSCPRCGSLHHKLCGERRTIDADRLTSIRSRLAAVEDGHPWKFNPKLEMFVGFTNAVEMYDRSIDLGRSSTEWVPSTDPNVKGYQRSRESIRKDAMTRALGEFLENVREDLRELLEAVEDAQDKARELRPCIDVREAAL
jgi:hypothetical protein